MDQVAKVMFVGTPVELSIVYPVPSEKFALLSLQEKLQNILFKLAAQIGQSFPKTASS